MYIAQAFKVQHDWWRYLIGVIIVIIGISIFSLPHIIAISIKQMQGEADLTRLDDVNYIMSLFESNINLIYMLLPFMGGLIFLILTSNFLHNQSFTSLTTSRARIDWNRVWYIFILWGIVSSGMVLLDYFLSPADYVINFEWKPFLMLAIIAFLLVPIQASFEEYLFRGYLMQGIGVFTKKKWIPLVFTSVVFGMLHIANPEVEKLGRIIMVYYIGTGLFLGIMTLMDEGLELAIGFHAANNLFTALLVTADWTAFQTHSILKDISSPSAAGFTDIFMPVFVVFPIILYILSKKYNWSDWKDKLLGEVEEPPKEDYKILE